ncbi:MAG: hypothetical protein PHR35_05915 [Kiritimatiellae bacterium]|nr:hypothetical protein [Kiritimatiellia bacterium]
MTLYWDVPGQRLIQSETNALEVTTLSLYARDSVPVRLFMIQEDGDGGWEAYTPSVGQAPIMMAKPATALEGASRFGTTFGEQDSEGAWIGVMLLTDATLLAEVDAAGAEGADYVLELTLFTESLLVDSDTTQVACTVLPDVHRAGDPLPGVVSPVGPWEYYTASDGRKGLRLRNAAGTVVAEFVEP